MNTKKIRTAHRLIDCAAVLHLLHTAWLAVMLAHGYADDESNLFRMYRGSSLLIVLIFIFLLDTVTTFLWHSYKEISQYQSMYTVHLTFYILAGGIFYHIFCTDIWNLHGFGTIALLILVPLIWLIGLIPFLIGGTGRRLLRKALDAQDASAGGEPV